ncbi:MAG: hypothetical protein AAGA68_26700 [Pseudomonadota bacterium]
MSRSTVAIQADIDATHQALTNATKAKSSSHSGPESSSQVEYRDLSELYARLDRLKAELRAASTPANKRYFGSVGRFDT